MSHRHTSFSCGPISPITRLRISSKVSGTEKYVITPESKLWPNQSSISYSFLDGSEAQQATVRAALTEYARYANVKFVFIGDLDAPANIRITFKGTEHKASSAIGTDALSLVEGQPTMHLGAIGRDSCSEEDYSIALHEVGHALGLAHEWTASDAKVIHEAHAEYGASNTERGASNFVKFDGNSIMRYFWSPRHAQEGNGVSINPKLSNSDKAWLSINYPGKIAESDGQRWSLLHSIAVLGIPAGPASRILLSKKVPEMRSHYAGHISGLWGDQMAAHPQALADISQHIRHHKIATPGQDKETEGFTVNQAVIEADATPPAATNDTFLSDVFASAILDPRFREVVINIATADLPQHGFKLSTPSPNQSPPDVQSGIISILVPLLTQVVGGLLFNVQAGQSGIQANRSDPLPDHVQRGIFDIITAFIKNPVFTSVVKAIAQGVVDANKPAA